MIKKVLAVACLLTLIGCNQPDNHTHDNPEQITEEFSGQHYNISSEDNKSLMNDFLLPVPDNAESYVQHSQDCYSFEFHSKTEDNIKVIVQGQNMMEDEEELNIEDINKTFKSSRNTLIKSMYSQYNLEIEEDFHNININGQEFIADYGVLRSGNTVFNYVSYHFFINDGTGYPCCITVVSETTGFEDLENIGKDLILSITKIDNE